MLVGVLSDTHDHIEEARLLIKLLLRRNVQLIIHLGDIISPFTLKFMLEEAKGTKFIAVYGNNCGEKLLLREIAMAYGAEIREPPHLVEIGGRRILLVHGWRDANYTREIVYSLAASGSYNIVLYGHTHEPEIKSIGSTLVANPGEACGCLTGRKTALLLDINTLRASTLSL